MANNRIKIEIMKKSKLCPKKLKIGGCYFMENTPGAEVPGGMCARAFHTIYPLASSMRFSDEMHWEKGKGYMDTACPDGTKYRLSRVK